MRVTAPTGVSIVLLPVIMAVVGVLARAAQARRALHPPDRHGGKVDVSLMITSLEVVSPP